MRIQPNQLINPPGSHSARIWKELPGWLKNSLLSLRLENGGDSRGCNTTRGKRLMLLSGVWKEVHNRSIIRPSERDLRKIMPVGLGCYCRT